MRLPIDKLLHLLVGALIVALLWPLNPALACSVCVAAAVGKELYDARHPERHTADRFDAAFTSLGGVLSCVWLVFVELVVTPGFAQAAMGPLFHRIP